MSDARRSYRPLTVTDRLIGRTRSGMDTQLHAVPDQNGRPLGFFMTAGQISDDTGANALLDNLPAAQWLLGNRGYDADWCRDVLEEKGVKPCIQIPKSRGKPIKYDKRKYKRRNRIEIMLEDSRTGSVLQHAITNARPSSSQQFA